MLAKINVLLYFTGRQKKLKSNFIMQTVSKKASFLYI